MIGLFGPSLVPRNNVLKRLPLVALILDADQDWAMVDGGATKPDAYAVVDSDSDIAADTAVTTGLLIGFDADGDPYAEVP